MKHRFEKRILSLILCITMVLTVLITNASFAFSATYSDGAIDGSEYSEELGNNIGNQVIFDWWSNFFIVDDPTREDIADIYEKTDVNSTYDDGENYWYLYEEKFYNDGTSTGQPFIDAYDVKMIITDYYYDDINGYHWYKVTGADLPEPLVEKPWILYTLDTYIEYGYDPYLCIYEIDEVIRFVTGERPDYKVDENFEIVKDENGDPIIERINQNFYVIAGPQELAGAEITINPNYSDYPISDLACVESTYGTTFSKSYDIIIDKAVGDDVDLWTESDGLVSIRYEVAQFGANTYTKEVICGGGFLYVDDKMYSATSSDLLGNEQSDLLYTNSGTSTVVFEIMNETFEYVGETAFFANDSVTLYGNMFEEGDFLAAQLPLTFSAEYYFIYNGEEYLWLEDKGFIGSQYFIVKKDDVLYGELPEEFGDGRVSVTDNKGNSVSEITLPMYEKPEFTAVSSLSKTTADVDYQWQIEYEDGKWVDIYGEDDKTIKISFGMVATLLNENGQCAIRCESKASTMVAYSKPIGITLEMYEPKEPDVVVSESFVTSNGETVTVSVAGDIPEDASVALEETDSTGVDVNPGETVVASLDISIKNADGTEWQPESGETVTVTLEASKIGLKNGDEFVVYHLHNGEVKILGTYVVENDTVTFDVDGFSKFVFALAVDTEQFEECIDKYATFNAWNEFIGEGSFDYFWLKADPSSETEGFYEWSIYDSDFSLDQVVQVKDYYIDSENSIWLRVEAVNGLELPASLKSRPWVHMNSLVDYDSSYDTLNLFVPQDTSGEDLVILNKYGLPVERVYMYTNEKKTVTAQTNLTGSVSYQWQVCYDAENYLWMDITGQTSESLTLSYALLAGVLDEEGMGVVRCVTSNAVETIEGGPLFVLTLEAYTDDSTYSLYGIIGQYVYDAFKALEAYGKDDVSGGSLACEASASYEKAVSGAAADNDNTVLVTVQFVMGDSTVPIENGLFTYNVPKNGNVTDSIVIPIVKGYAAYYEDDRTTVISGKYVLNETNITEPKTITFRFWPAEVDYKVVFMQQNVLDDEYTIVRTDNLTGFTGSDPFIEEIAYEGFVKVWFDTDKIAADGSTTIEVKYDRLYYKMLFDLDGGYGVQPVYARYETPVSVVNPTKAGYTFMGWNALNGPYNSSDDANTADIETFTNIKIPALHTNYKAIWKATDDAKVTVVIWGQKADNSDDLTDHNSYDYMAKTEDNTDLTELHFYAKPGTSVTYNPNGGYICGYTEEHVHGDDNCEITCGEEAHTHTSIGGACYSLSCGSQEHTAHTEECYACGQVSHNHTTECYDNVWDQYIANPQNAPTGREGLVYKSGRYSYIYINGSWYYYLGSTGSGNIAPTKCGQTESDHTHSDACGYKCSGIHAHTSECYTLTCNKKVHTHNESCYSSCTKEEHTHGADCSLDVPMESSLWEFDHADEVVVSADGTTTLNVYYRRKQFTLTFNYNYSNGSYKKQEKITARWGENIHNEYTTITTDAGGTFWSEKNTPNSYSNTFTNYIGIMPKRSVTYYNWGESGRTGSMTYYGQDQNGAYTVKLFEVPDVGGFNITDEDKYEFNGFKFSHFDATQDGSGYDCEGAVFYYTRNDYNLVFDNYGKTFKNESVLYEAPLAGYGADEYEVPDSLAPDIYQPGSVTFAGWYSAPQTPRDFNFKNVQPFDFTNSTMPANDLKLYAWWKPVSHNVTFYYDYPALESDTVYTEDGEEKKFSVPHGSKIQDPYTPPKDPTSNYYSFVGWTYRDKNGNEILWDFDNSTVTEDIKLYGKWNSTTAAEYTVMFVTYKDGVEVEIADRITGSALGGTPKTFDAKFNEDLYVDYQDRYYPRDMSHTITINLEDTSKNVYKFVYDYVAVTEYTVKYLDKETGKPMSEIDASFPAQKTVSNNTHAMVTETFVAIPGYLPDAYQKVCMIDPDGNNEIIFYYTKDNENGLYVVHFWLQSLEDPDVYVEAVDLMFTGTAKKGATVTTPTNTVIENYTYYEAHPNNVSTGTVSIDEITHLHMYYNRNVYKYKVQYLEAGTNTVLAPDKNGQGKWQELITENANNSAINFDIYKIYGMSEQSIEISSNESENIITFYYEEKRVKLNYAVVGPDGTVDLDGNAVFGEVAPTYESVMISSGKATGSVATPSSNLYKFVGWYSDAACTDKVGDTETFVPTKDADKLWINGTTYYAKFEYNLTSLTIDKNFPKDADYSMDENQSFLFDVVEVDASGEVVKGGAQLRVTIHGDGQITIDGLTVGHYYKIIEKKDWSWRYGTCTPTSAIYKEVSADGWIIVKLTAKASDNLVTFKNERTKDQWLDGDSWCNNLFK